MIEAVNERRPDVLIVDSIQTLYNGDLTAAPGSVGQVKDCTMALMQIAKGQGITVFVIGHVNKEGSIAGPKVLEHMVDCVLYFEGEQQNSYRILRAAKNRFGATNEIGVFDMGDSGLTEVPNPSEMLLVRAPPGRTGHLCDLRDGGRSSCPGRGAGSVGARPAPTSPAGLQTVLTIIGPIFCWLCWRSGAGCG